MDAIKYIKERYRMCEKYPFCGGCPLREINKEGTTCDTAVKNHAEEAVSVVKKWSEEHPKKKTNGDMIKALLPKERKYTLPAKDIITINLDKDWWDAESPEHDGCKNCKHSKTAEWEEPCNGCKQNYMDRWEKRDD